ncbi:MAG: AEC family transporter [Veillonella sp.]|nr:AEC family transporter [Veillonella sp.]
MNIFELISHIFMTSMVPLFLLVAGGYILDKKFSLDMKTLSKLNFYLFLPAFIFYSMYNAKFDISSVELIVCALLVVFFNYVVARIAGNLMGFDAMKNAAQRNVVMFTNAANIGVALAIFVYSNQPFLGHGQTPYLKEGISAALTVLLIQTTFSNTFGFYQAGAGRLTTRDAILVVFKMPMIYVIPAALICKFWLPLDLNPTFAMAPFKIFSGAYVPIAMLALGSQINRTPLNFFHKDIMTTTFLRIIGGPIIALLVALAAIQIYGPLSAVTAQTLVLMYATPSAVNMGLIAIEMRNNPEYTTQVIMATTIFSAITMPIFILLAYIIFPL